MPRRRNRALILAPLALAAACLSSVWAGKPLPPTPIQTLVRGEAPGGPAEVLRAGWSHDDSLLAISDGRTIQIRDGRSGELRAEERIGRQGERMAWSPRGVFADPRLVIATDDGRLHVWSMATGRRVELSPQVGAPAAQPAMVRAIHFCPTAPRLLLQTSTGLTLWDLAAGTSIAVAVDSWQGVRPLAWSADGRTFAVALATATAAIHDGVTGRSLRRIALPNVGLVSALAWSSDGRLAFGTERGLVKLALPVAGATTRLPFAISALAWSPDGKVLAIGLGDAAADPDTSPSSDEGALLWDTRSAQPRALPERRPGVAALAWSRTGDRLAIAGSVAGEVSIVEPTTGRTLRVLDGGTVFPTGDLRRAVQLRGDDRLEISDATTGATLIPLPRDEGRQRITVTAAATDPLRLLWVRRGHTFALDLRAGALLRELPDHADRALDPAGRRVAAFDAGRRSLSITDLTTGALEAPGIAAPGVEGLHSARWGAAGRYLSALDPSGERLFVWELATGALLRTLPHGPRQRAQRAWSPDENLVESAYDRDAGHVIEATDVRTGAPRWSVVVDGAGHFPVWTPDSRVIAYDAGGVAGGHLRLADGSSGATLVDLEGKLLSPWSPDGKRIAILPVKRGPCLFSLERKACDVSLPGDAREDGEISFAPDGALLARWQRRARQEIEILDATDGHLRTTVANPLELTPLWVSATLLALVGPELELHRVTDGTSVRLVADTGSLAVLSQSGLYDGSGVALSRLRYRPGPAIVGLPPPHLSDLPDRRRPGLLATFIAGQPLR